VLKKIEEGPRRTAGVKELTGLSLSAVKVALALLREAGLVRKTGKHWQRTDMTLDEAAALRGLTGYTEKLRAAYKRQGEEYVESVRDQGRERKLKEMRTKTPTGAPEPVWGDARG